MIASAREALMWYSLVAFKGFFSVNVRVLLRSALAPALLVASTAAT
jgi:hypothetical protein